MKALPIAAAAFAAGLAFAQQPPAEYVQRVADNYRAAFVAADTGGRGYITRADLVGNLLMLPVFDTMDVNRDGLVTKEELERFLASMPPSAT
jgi:Ca2+-binding EF-hand superfamily protein